MNHSFRRLLNKDTKAYQSYVLSDARYQGMLPFLQQRVSNAETGHALDVGCGAGIVSRGLAQLFGKVTGVDGDPDNITLAEEFSRDAGIDNASFMAGSATELPIESNSVDLVMLNGVLEWVGQNTDGENPKSRQLTVLSEAQRVLRNDGILYLGIENRWHPRTMRRDPHSKLPWVNALPRVLANVISHMQNKEPFQTYIYGSQSYRRMLRNAGFASVETFVPFTGYQFPIAYVRADTRHHALSDIADINVSNVQNILDSVGRNVNVEYAVGRIRQKTTLGMLQLLAHDFVFVAHKNSARSPDSR